MSSKAQDKKSIPKAVKYSIIISSFVYGMVSFCMVGMF